MQDRVLDAADILVHRQPALHCLRIGGSVGEPGRGEAGVIPGRIHEGVHRVRLATGRRAAGRAGDIAPGVIALQRVARHVEGDLLRQGHRQIGCRHRHGSAGVAMDDRDRAAPVALARHAPVAQAELHFSRCDRRACDDLLFEAVGHRLERLVGGHVVEEARIDHAPVAVIGGVGDDEVVGPHAFGADHGGVAEPILVREIEVALVVGRAAEHGAGAVLHQHEVRDVDRQQPGRVEGVADLQPGVEAEFLGRVDRRLGRAGATAFGNEALQVGARQRGLGRDRMVRGDRQELRAEEGVGARGIDLDLAFARVQCETDHEPFRSADPVLLHDPDFLRPTIEPVEGVVEVLREVGDLEEPLGQLALLDHGARAPAAPVDDLLVGQHRVVDRVPVHLGGAARHESLVQEVEEHALLVLVIGRIAGRDLAAPVERQAHRLQLRAHAGDVGIGPVARVDLAFHRGVLGRQAEGVPAHRVQNVKSLGALVAGHHVAHRIIADMAHMDAARGVGKHLQDVIGRARVVVAGAVDAGLVPGRLPARLDILGVVALRRCGAVGQGRHRQFAATGSDLKQVRSGTSTGDPRVNTCALGAHLQGTSWMVLPHRPRAAHIARRHHGRNPPADRRCRGWPHGGP